MGVLAFASAAVVAHVASQDGSAWDLYRHAVTTNPVATKVRAEQEPGRREGPGAGAARPGLYVLLHPARGRSGAEAGWRRRSSMVRHNLACARNPLRAPPARPPRLPGRQTPGAVGRAHWLTLRPPCPATPRPNRQAAISGVVYALGDIMAQSYEGRSVAEWDRPRIARSGLCGFLAHGPLSHYYYLALDSWFAGIQVRAASPSPPSCLAAAAWQSTLRRRGCGEARLCGPARSQAGAAGG